MRGEREVVTDGARSEAERSVLGIVQSIAVDSAALIRKEVELARQEILEAVTARLKAAGAMAAAGVVALLGVVFLGAAAAEALDLVMPAWAARLVVAVGLLLLAAAAAGFGIARLKRPPLAPEETKRTVKEDLEWAKAQLRR